MELTTLNVASEKGSAFAPFGQRRAVDVIASGADIGAAAVAGSFLSAAGAAEKKSEKCNRREKIEWVSI